MRRSKRCKEMIEQQKKKTRRRGPSSISSKITKRPVPEVKSLKDLIKVGRSIRFYKNLDTVMLWRITPYLEELDNMVGMKTLKESVFYQIIYYLKGMHKHNKNEEYLHTIITGAPGTGKSSVARIIGKIYQTMGILSRSGPFKIAYRDDFIAEYLGQTALKTRKLLKSCIGGVLFIDEVYALGPGNKDKDSFSKEAIDTITGFLSEHKNDFCCIAAGYEEDIKRCFFNVNKGLERRFQWIHRIGEYSNSELVDIVLKMVQEMEWSISVSREEIIKLVQKNKDMFKHCGGDVQNFLTKCKLMHAQRVFSLDSSHMFIFTQKDLEKGIELMKKNRFSKQDKSHYNFSMYT
jgi:stage V sporulation protein K